MEGGGRVGGGTARPFSKKSPGNKMTPHHDAYQVPGGSSSTDDGTSMVPMPEGNLALDPKLAERIHSAQVLSPRNGSQCTSFGNPISSSHHNCPPGGGGDDDDETPLAAMIRFKSSKPRRVSVQQSKSDAFNTFLAADSLTGLLSAMGKIRNLYGVSASVTGLNLYNAVKRGAIPDLGIFQKKIFYQLDLKIKSSRRFTSCGAVKAVVVGAGPCGLRSAIELACLGADVLVLEKKGEFERSNPLELWDWVCDDLLGFGACENDFIMEKKGAQIETKRLQLILAEVALLLGVTICTNASFVDVKTPPPPKKKKRRGIPLPKFFTNKNKKQVTPLALCVLYNVAVSIGVMATTPLYMCIPISLNVSPWLRYPLCCVQSKQRRNARPRFLFIQTCEVHAVS
jgi:hypothetical protein